MRKLILFFLLLPILSIAQKERIDFISKLTYEMETPSKTMSFNLYYSPKGSILEPPEEKRNSSSVLIIKEQILVSLTIGLDKIATFPKYGMADSILSFTLTKTNKKDNINGISCTYYDLKIENKPDEAQMCIAENHPLNLLGTLPVTNKNSNGLIVKIGSKKNENENFQLKSIEKTDSYITLDWNEIKADVEESFIYRAPYMMADSVTTEFETIPDEYIAEVPDINVDEYKSEYRSEKTETIDLAIAHLEENSPYWQGIPAYCKKLDEKVSLFTNEQLKKHSRNYAGQICDLYLSEIKEYSVDVKGTLDKIRYEENYFRNVSLDKKEKELLNNFLNKLD